MSGVRVNRETKWTLPPFQPAVTTISEHVDRIHLAEVLRARERVAQFEAWRDE